MADINGQKETAREVESFNAFAKEPFRIGHGAVPGLPFSQYALGLNSLFTSQLTTAVCLILN